MRAHRTRKKSNKRNKRQVNVPFNRRVLTSSLEITQLWVNALIVAVECLRCVAFPSPVTSVTKIKGYPLRLTLEAQKKTRVFSPPQIQNPLPKSGDCGDDGDPGASDCRPSVKAVQPSLRRRKRM